MAEAARAAAGGLLAGEAASLPVAEGWRLSAVTAAPWVFAVQWAAAAAAVSRRLPVAGYAEAAVP